MSKLAEEAKKAIDVLGRLLPNRRKRCKAKIYKRDTYRYTGRSKSGFEMHYTEKQCKRAAVDDTFCKQHAAIKARGGNPPTCPWAREYMEHTL